MKIDISSSAIEKGLDLISSFIEKLAGSSIEEAGLLLADKVKLRRLNNQIKIFSKAKKIAEENNLSIRQINLKTLVPLLEFSSLEEDENLQEKWSNLIVNFSNANANYESSIFPFILNQLSSREALELDRIIKLKKEINSNLINLNEIEISNLKRLGILERVSLEGFAFTEDEIIPIYYTVTDIGFQFIDCCSKVKLP